MIDNSLLWSTYVYDWYQDYIPWFIYSVLRAYPQDYCRIFLREPLNPRTAEALAVIRDVSPNFEVIDRHHPEFCGDQRCYRFIQPKENFAPYRYAIVGDIDMLILPPWGNRTGQFQWHKANAERMGVPYSNAIAKNGPGLLTSYGHFIDVEPYYEKIQPVIDAALNMPMLEMLSTPAWFAERSRRLLYSLCDQAHGIPDSIRDVKAFLLSWPSLHLHYILHVIQNGRDPSPIMRSKKFAYEINCCLDTATAHALRSIINKGRVARVMEKTWEIFAGKVERDFT